MNELDKLTDKVTHLDNEVFFLQQAQVKLMARLEKIEAAYNSLLPKELRPKDGR